MRGGDAAGIDCCVANTRWSRGGDIVPVNLDMETSAIKNLIIVVGGKRSEEAGKELGSIHIMQCGRNHAQQCERFMKQRA